MKSSLRKLRGLVAIHKHDPKERRGHQPLAHQDELSQASQDMQDMRNCYDSLLSAAAATANSAYEFSEALREMGTCLVEKTALDDEESGSVLLMLGKAQLELQKLVDSYRVHIIQTITIPSESLLKELEIVEEMKRQCDDKRNLCKFMLAAQREKGRSRNTQGESFSSLQIQAAQEDYEEEATLFVFRLKSLKQGQFRSLLTQAARHHASQLSFFRKGVKSLEMVEPHVKVIAEQQHIDYQFSGLEDEDSEDDNDDSHNGNDAGELSFDYGQNDQGQDSSRRNSMELDQVDHRNAPTSTTETAKENLNRSQPDLLPFRGGLMAGSQSAPILAETKYEISERIKQMRPSTRKFHTYVLPTPVDARSSALTGSGTPDSAARLGSKDTGPTQLWNSSEANKSVKGLRYNELSSPTRFPKAQSVLKESNINSGPIRLPPPLAEGLMLPQFNPDDAKKIKRQFFSGPLTSKAWSSKPMFSAMSGHVPTSQPSVSPKASPSASPPMSSPRISELHKLPRPPISSEKPRRPGLIGHSAPLVSGGQKHSTTGTTTSIAHHKATPLPTPPGTMTRSFSIPSSSHRTPMSTVSKLLEVPHNQNMMEDISSPPLTPISLTNIQPASSASESVTHATGMENFYDAGRSKLKEYEKGFKA